ncbi:hypothetical protein F4780DRAFT_771362 [Xylariomycetidae sp. FL0641]|nr:hypothetical protein F4780DRAFT_771362 [Xylariomycetidae sp. FL0641]
MYRDENKTLKETMQLMQDTHDFFATVRMYKARFQQWGIEKKIKAEDAVEIFRQQTARAKAGKSSVAYVRGRRINPDRLQRYRYRAAALVSEQILLAERASSSSTSSSSSPESATAASHIICRTPSPELSETPSISPRLEDPPVFKVPQDCMHILGNYIIGSFEAGVWQQTDPDTPEVNDAFTWAHYLHASQDFMKHGRTTEGFALLGICFDQYKAHLHKPDSFFWLATYKAVVLLGKRDKKLGEAFMDYASKLTRLTLPPAHPFNLVWSRIMETGLPGLQAHAAALFQSYLDTWRNHLTMMQADAESIVQMCFVFALLHCNGMLSHTFLREIVIGAMSLLPASEAQARSQYLLQESRFRMGVYLIENNKFNKAETIIEEIAYWLDCQLPSDPTFLHLRCKCMWAMFNIRDRKGAHAEALQVGHELIKLSQAIYGPVHLQTLNALSAVEDLVHRMDTGDAVVQKMTSDFDTRWAVFDQLGKANKGYPHLITKPWFHRCSELEEDQQFIQETIDLFERCSWLQGP